MRWALVVPVKRLTVAKSRLASLVGALRADLALAMAVDTLAAALDCPAVETVVVVTDDPAAAAAARHVGAHPVPDVPDAGLNRALEHAALVAQSRCFACGVAALSADLPALRSGELDRVLGAAAGHPRAFLPDAAGSGTTVLSARPGVPLAPAYGADSRNRHRRGGAVELRLAGVESVRCDVDTPGDLAAAARLGVGPRTRGVLARLDAGLGAGHAGVSRPR